MDNRFKGRSMRQSYDWGLVIIYLLLVFIGWANIYASVHSAEPSSIFDLSVRSGMQFIWMMSAFGLGALILLVIPPRLWESASLPLYLIVLALLVVVIFVSKDVKGSHSWFEFGPVKFQPAEVSKITTSLVLALLMSQVNFKISKPRDFLLAAAVIGLPMLVIVAESETGSALVYVGFIFVLYREGMSGWVLLLLGMAILLFILTLTASPYASILVAIGVISFCNALNTGRLWRWLAIFGSYLLVMALLPWGLQALCGWLVPAAMPGDNPDMVEEVLPEVSHWVFLLKIKPVHLLLLSIAAALPFVARRAYREKNHFLSLSVGALLVAVALVFSTEFLFEKVLQDHQRSRIEVLLGMKEDPTGVGYNVAQSKIAIGSGGFLGKGYLHGTQTTYGFVPEQSTDFIFCTVGEEWGFLGCAVVILLYVFLIARIIRDAERSREHFTRIYGYCVASCLFMHLFINVGMTIGLMPVIGIPLPLMSYGGSSLWAFTVLLFIFIVLDHEERKYF